MMEPTLRICLEPWGEMVSFDDPAKSMIQWLPSDFIQRELEFCVVGNQRGPLVEDANSVLQISRERERIFKGIERFLLENKDRYPFLPSMENFELDWLQFFDPARSDRFYANCVAEFSDHARAVPKSGCAGNGFWQLKFEFEAMYVIDLIGE